MVRGFFAIGPSTGLQSVRPIASIRADSAHRNAGGLDPSHPIREQNTKEQNDGQADPYGESFDHVFCLSFISHHKEQGRTQAADDADEGE
jgi:surfeit locus 1 family protein